jgi:hypothetical protein
VRRFKHPVQIAALPTIHLCLVVYLGVLNNAWDWMLLALIDFPLVILSMLGKRLGDWWAWGMISPLGLAIFGTLWWLCVGIVLSRAFDWIASKIKADLAKPL